MSIEEVTGDGVGDLVFGAAPGAGLLDRYVSGSLLQTLAGDGSSASVTYEYFVNDIVVPAYDAAGRRLAELIPYIHGDSQ